MSPTDSQAGWEDFFWTAFERSRLPMALLDEERRYVEANPAHLELYGYRPEDLVGRQVDEFLPEHELPTVVFARGDFADRSVQQAAMADCLEAHGAQLVVLAGFDQILVPEFVARFPRRMINLHPSLLPAFPGGMHAVRDALAQAKSTP